MQKLFILFLVLSFCGSLSAQTSEAKIFVLGQDEETYNKLLSDNNQTLLEATNSDLEKAFNNWIGMMQEIDKSAEKYKFDIKGVKLIMHVFWNADGTIQAMGFLTKPDSRNIPENELKAFFKLFAKKYTFPVKSTNGYHFYSQASFPTFSQKAEN